MESTKRQWAGETLGEKALAGFLPEAVVGTCGLRDGEEKLLNYLEVFVSLTASLDLSSSSGLFLFSFSSSSLLTADLSHLLLL